MGRTGLRSKVQSSARIASKPTPNRPPLVIATSSSLRRCTRQKKSRLCTLLALRRQAQSPSARRPSMSRAPGRNPRCWRTPTRSSNTSPTPSENRSTSSTAPRNSPVAGINQGPTTKESDGLPTRSTEQADANLGPGSTRISRHHPNLPSLRTPPSQRRQPLNQKKLSPFVALRQRGWWAILDSNQ